MLIDFPIATMVKGRVLMLRCVYIAVFFTIMRRVGKNFEKVDY